MGEPPEVEVRPGTAVAIATGAPLPPGADAVVKIEHTQAPPPSCSRSCAPPRRAREWSAPTRTPPRAPSWCRPGARCAPRTSECSPPPD